MADPLVRTIEVVRATDPALALSPGERRDYAQTRDPLKIRELPGQRAVRFVVRPLGNVDCGAVERSANASEIVVRSFWLGCVEIRDADEMGPRVGACLRPTMRMNGRDACAWSDSELEAIQETFGRAAIYEIGTVIYERTLRGKAAGGSVPYTVPQSSLDELTSMEARLRAAQAQSEQGKTSST